jgi:hypothetical protein
MHGSLAAGATPGTFVYTPTAGFSGTDTFTYTVSDDSTTAGQQPIAGFIADDATGTVTINVLSQSLQAQDVSATVLPNSQGNLINVVASTSDPAQFPVALSSIGQPQHGTTSISNGMVVYTPASNYAGPDSFAYTVSDGHGGQAVASVAVNVVSQNPSANTDTVQIPGNSSNNAIDVLANDTDPGHFPLTVISATTPAHGTAIVSSTGVLYTPKPGYSGPDTFTYKASDGHGGTATGTVDITVLPAASKLSLVVPSQIHGRHGTVSFKLHPPTLGDTNSSAPVRVVLHATRGVFHIGAAGVRITGNNTRSLVLSGSAASVNQALRAVSLGGAAAGTRAQVILTASDNRSSIERIIDLVF